MARAGVQVTFAPMQQQQTVQVNTVADTTYEQEENFFGVLSLPSGSDGVTLGTQDTATVTILDDDGKSCEAGKNPLKLRIIIYSF